MNYVPWLEGLVLGASLIIAIGAQNAFILKQGLKREHLFLTAMTCAVADSLLIYLGVEGIGELFSQYPMLSQIFRWGGALFLILYGIRSFYSAFHPHILVAALDNPEKSSAWLTFVALLGFTFLNPHVYVDTFLLLGTIGAERPLPDHIPFVMGAISASFIWFFGLTYGASYLSVYFKKPRAWQIVDTLMGIVMIGIAINLIWPQ